MRNIFFEADEEGYDTYESFAGPYRYNYDMQTPWKAMFSLATVLMQKAIISLDSNSIITTRPNTATEKKDTTFMNRTATVRTTCYIPN